MKTLSKYQCEYCHTEYREKSACEQCEKNHLELKLTCDKCNTAYGAKYGGRAADFARLTEDIPAADVKKIVKCEKCKYARFQYNDDKYPFGVYSCEKQPAGRAYKKSTRRFFLRLWHENG